MIVYLQYPKKKLYVWTSIDLEGDRYFHVGHIFQVLGVKDDVLETLLNCFKEDKDRHILKIPKNFLEVDISKKNFMLRSDQVPKLLEYFSQSIPTEVKEFQSWFEDNAMNDEQKLYVYKAPAFMKWYETSWRMGKRYNFFVNVVADLEIFTNVARNTHMDHIEIKMLDLFNKFKETLIPENYHALASHDKVFLNHVEKFGFTAMPPDELDELPKYVKDVLNFTGKSCAKEFFYNLGVMTEKFCKLPSHIEDTSKPM